MKPTALVLPPQSRLDQVCSPESKLRIREIFDPIWNPLDRDYTIDELKEQIANAEVLLTSWGSPVLTEEAMEMAGKLRMIGHAAGSIKHRVPFACFDRNIRLFSAARRIALSVGEYCLAGLLTALRHLPDLDRKVREGAWGKKGDINNLKGQELTGQTVGIVSASSTAREFIRLLKPFRNRIRVYDPYLREEDAAGMGVETATLEEVMSCPIVSVHAPKLAATKSMIDGRLLSLLPDGAIFINSSRSDVVEHRALMEQLQLNRFHAVLDVHAQEPIAPDDPVINCENTLLTPHVAGGTVQGHLALMGIVIEDMIRSMQGKPTLYEVTRSQWETQA